MSTNTIANSVKVKCPECGSSGNIKRALVGQNITCPKCKKKVVFLIPVQSAEKDNDIKANYRSKNINDSSYNVTPLKMRTMRKIGTKTEFYDDDIDRFVKSADWMTVLIGVGGILLILIGVLMMGYTFYDSFSNPYLTGANKILYILAGLFFGVGFVCLGLIQYAVRIFVMKFSLIMGRMLIATESISSGR